MGKYLYDDEGNRYRAEKDDDSTEGALYLFLLGVALLIAFAPGMVLTSLFASFISTSLWAWVWSVLFSIVLFFLIYWLYNANIGRGNPWIWTVVTYIILSGLSIWLLIESEGENIVKVCQLLKFE
ncbi:hypothetical protein [Dysgonomonas sp. 520]|uniref:hypothetical protein n=1 Tax=Dysgonomonas sp. 520 TaxID=2302931 RepID=UPI0013D7BF7F|nr:hypothetical protein [Dysgonomonas sp. 520]NDW11234.1 hypothetical protein [Dysgonomonas sp. 520]